MAGRRGGRIINISSIPAVRPRLYMSAYVGSKATVTSHPQEPVVSDLVERIPIGRLGLPEDVAKLVAFLSSDEAEFITGQAYNLTGWRELA